MANNEQPGIPDNPPGEGRKRVYLKNSKTVRVQRSVKTETRINKPYSQSDTSKQIRPTPSKRHL